MISSHLSVLRVFSLGLSIALACLFVGLLPAQEQPGLTPQQRILRANGGNVAVEAAVAAGLKWIIRHQAPAGHWSLDRFHEDGRCNCTGPGEADDVAATALALLPLLGVGETHKSRDKQHLYAHNMERGLKYLLTRQANDGKIGDTMLGQGLATLALCEAYGITADPVLKGPAQRALHFLIAAQNGDGSWGERRRSDARRPIADDSTMLASLVPLGELFPRITSGDVYLFGWQMLALRSGTIAGLSVPNENYKRCGDYIDNLSTAEGSRYVSFLHGRETPASTACGLFCRQLLGWGPRNPGMTRGVEYLLKESPPDSMDNIRQGYHTTRVMFSMGPDIWEKWHPKMRDLLIERQDKGLDPDHRDQKGSWPPDKDAHGKTAGRLAISSLSLLTLEIYYTPARRPLGAMKDEAIRDAVK